MTEVRRALVTGAARGIGAAIALRLHRDGFDVVTADISDGCTLTLDVASDPFPVLDDIDVCVANAALTNTIARSHKMSEEQWRRDVDVNLTGAFRTVQACIEGMRERGGGRIVAISSVAAIRGLPGQAAYAASKAGLLGLVRTLAAEYAAAGITANAVLPGLVATEQVLAMPDQIRRRAMEALPSGRLVQPEEIAAVVAFLASAEAGQVSGQAIAVDGAASLSQLALAGGGGPPGGAG